MSIDTTDITSTEHLLSLRAPLHASLSADGERLLLTTVEVPIGTVEEVVRVSVIDMANGTEAPFAEDGAHSAVWSPDGAVAWVQNDTVRIDGRPVDTEFTVAGAPSWGPGSLAVAARRGTVIDRTKPYRWTRPIMAADGITALEDPPQLRVIDVATGEGRWLTDDGWRWSAPRWSPSGDRIAAIASNEPTGVMRGSHLRIVSLDGTVVSPGVAGRALAHQWLPDGRLVVLASEPHPHPLGSTPRLYLVDGGGVSEQPLADPLGDVYGDNPAEMADRYDTTLLPVGGSKIVVRVGARGRMGIVLFDVDTHEVQMVADGPRCCSPVDYAGGRLVFTSQSAEAPVEVKVWTAERGERPITDLAAGWTNGTTVRRFTVAAPIGEVDAWFVAPSDAAGPVPTVLMIHGGPHFTYGECCNFDIHALCAAGFAVVYTNPRGSNGYGDAFAQAVHEDWADGPASDLMAVLDHVVAQGWADGARLGVAGGSYGGYMTAWLCATTERFRAGVAENPVSDLAAMYATSDIGVPFFTSNFHGGPHVHPDVYRTQSPLWEAHRCRTPMLFVSGDQDRRCPPAQSFAMHRVLCDVGTPSEVLVLPGCSHEGATYGPIPCRLAHDEALVEWMTRWL